MKLPKYFFKRLSIIILVLTVIAFLVGLFRDKATSIYGFWISIFLLSVWIFLPDIFKSKCMFLKTINIKRGVIIYVVWLILSFTLPYYLITSGVSSPKWMFFSSAFLSYLIYFQSVSIIGLVYILTNGKFSEIKKHIRTIIVATAILTVFAFALVRWSTLTTNYGQYGHYVEMAPVENTFYFEYGGDTNFEKETIYREAVKSKYDVAFQQIWIFGSFIFFSTILILMVVDKKNKE